MNKRYTRLLFLFAAILVCILLVPATTYATDYVESVGVTIAEPVVGGTPGDATVSGSGTDGYTYVKTEWVDGGGSVSGTFKCGKTYYAEVTLELEYGKSISSDHTTLLLNGKTNAEYEAAGSQTSINKSKSYIEGGNDYVVLRMQFVIPYGSVDSVHFTLSKPVVGQTPVNDFAPAYSGENREAWSVDPEESYWCSSVGWKMDESTTFSLGHTYTYMVTLTADAGYKFTDAEPVCNSDIPEITTDWRNYGTWATLDIYYTPVAHIDNVSCTVVAPMHGEVPDMTVTVPDGAPYTAEIQSWDVLDNGSKSYYGYGNLGNEFSTFEAGKTYCAKVKFKSETGYILDSDATYKINGIAADSYSTGNDNERFKQISFTGGGTLISDASCTVENPISGKEPSMTVTVPEGANYTAEVENWYYIDDKTYYYTGTGVEPGAGQFTYIHEDFTYSVRVKFKRNSGYYFDETTDFTVNGIDTNGYAADVGYRYCEVPLAEKLTAASCTVVQPKNGNTPDMSVALPDDAHYTAAIKYWQRCSDSKRYFGPTGENGFDKFEGNNTYFAKVQFTPDAGYYFIGSPEFTINGAAATTLGSGDYSPNSQDFYVPYEYTVKFNANGGKGSMEAAVLERDKDQALPLGTFTRSGYKLVGWTKSKKGTGTVYADGATVNNLAVTNGSVTLYAKWISTATKYTITYKLNGGTATGKNPTYFKVTSGTIAIADLSIPMRGGYDFGGWYSNSALTTPAKDIVSGSYKKVTIYAKWIPHRYTVHFDANGGTGAKADMNFVYGTAQKVSNAGAFTRTGYKFSGWKLGGTSYKDGASIKNLTKTDGGEVTLQAKWAVNKKSSVYKYKISFNGNGATKGKMSTLSMYVGTSKVLTANAYSRTGYHFVGWSPEPTGGVYYLNKAKVLDLNILYGQQNVVLYAVWAPNSYTILFDANGGSGTMAPQNALYDAGFSLNGNEFTREGWIFAGWSNNKDYRPDADGTLYDNHWTNPAGFGGFTTADNGSVTLYAIWSPTQYYVQYDANGAGSFADGADTLQAVTYGVAKKALDVSGILTPNEGYTLAGWSTVSENVGGYMALDADVSDYKLIGTDTQTLYAVWLYEVFLSNPETGSEGISQMVYNESYFLGNLKFEAPEGYEFAGWTADLNTSGKNGTVQYKDGESYKNLPANATLYPVWKPVTYKVVFHCNHGKTDKTKTQTLTYDKAAALTANAFTWKGHKFKNWKTADGLTVYANKQSVKNLTNVKNEVIHLYAVWS